jgi:UDP-N-acetyl-2-amino-2-deoxyglucuronate dehydrogenase
MKKFNVGVVGYGWAAGAHIAAINATPMAQVVAVCSSRRLDAGQLSARHGAELRTFTKYQEMLRQPDLDAISICSYHRQHKEHAVAAAKAGKHIICEKPLALSLPDVRAIEAAVREASVKFCICFELRFSAQFQEIKRLIDRGRLGQLHYGEIDYYHGIGPWYREYEWCTTNAACGSSLLAAGCHALDALLLCLGEEVEEVFMLGNRSAHPTYARYEYPPTTVALLKFKNGCVGKCASVIDCWQPYYFHTHLIGSEGSLLDDKFHSNLEAGPDDRSQWKELPYKPVDSGDVADHPYQTQFTAFFEALAGDREMPLTSLREAVQTHEVIFAAEESLRLGRPVKFEEFVRR